jgi:hypothetical protein
MACFMDRCIHNLAPAMNRPFIQIGADCGRSGPFWWYSSDTQPRYFTVSGLPAVRWGTFGIGQPHRIRLEAVSCSPSALIQ